MIRTITIISTTLLLALFLTACEARDKSRTQNTQRPMPAVNVPQQQFIPPTKPDTISLATLPELGEKLSDETIGEVAGNRTMILTGPDHAEPMFFAEVDGVISMLAYKKDYTVSFVSVTNPEFVSSEGIKIGDHLRSVLAQTKTPEITIDTAFAFFVPLSSGWNAAFGIASLNRGILHPDSTVTYFFRK